MRIAFEEAEISKKNGENPFGTVLLDQEYNFCHKSQINGKTHDFNSCMCQFESSQPNQRNNRYKQLVIYDTNYLLLIKVLK